MSKEENIKAQVARTFEEAYERNLGPQTQEEMRSMRLSKILSYYGENVNLFRTHLYNLSIAVGETTFPRQMYEILSSKLADVVNEEKATIIKRLINIADDLATANED